MRSRRNVVLGVALGTLAVAGTLWAKDGNRIPIIKTKAGLQKAAAPSPAGIVSVTIVNEVDRYEAADRAEREQAYHAQIGDPSLSWEKKCQVAINHNRLELLSSDMGGTLGGTIERGTSRLRIRLTCPQEALEFEIPANFEVHTAPHPEEIKEMSFATHMYAIEGRGTDLAGAFKSFSLVGGTGNGFESPGHTSLIPGPDGTFAVDSTFNIGYRIEFVGADDGPLKGFEGTIESSILMKAYGE